MGKRIDQLDSYGSVNEIKADDDLFEVSKNSGSPGFPIYARSDSKKITRKELSSLMGGIPYSGPNYEVVRNGGTALENGAKLLQAAATCYAKMPNGNSLSETNMADVYFLAGDYDLGSDFLPVSTFVNFISLSSPNSVLITSSNAVSTIQIDIFNNYSLSGFRIENTGGGKSIGHDTNRDDHGKWSDLYIVSGGTVENTNFAGKYINCDSTSVDGFLNGNITGIVKDCDFGFESCGYSLTASVTISGKIKGCTAAGNSFGCSKFSDVIISGEIKNSDGSYNSFGYANVDGASVTISGKIKGCTAAADVNFGSTPNGNTSIVVSGIIEDCTANNAAFGYSPTAANTIVSGKIKGCTLNGGSAGYGSTTITGIIENCEGYGSSGVHLGLINNCRFNNPIGVFGNAIELGDGGIIKYTSVLQFEPTKDGIKISSGASVMISLCESNKDFNAVSGDSYTNLIPLPRNVIWTQKGEIYVSEILDPTDGFYHKFRKYIDSSGEWQTEDLGPV